MYKRTERIRTVRFAPYAKGHGPAFILSLWDVDGCSTDEAGRYHVGYVLEYASKADRKAFGGPIFDSDVNGTWALRAGL